jgi:hypothetical protein
MTANDSKSPFFHQLHERPRASLSTPISVPTKPRVARGLQARGGQALEVTTDSRSAHRVFARTLGNNRRRVIPAAIDF